MTGYHDYLIVLSPNDGITREVKNLKERCYKKIGEFDSYYSKAHISVQKWPRKKPVWIEPMLPKLIRDLQTLPPVILEINGFNFFDHPDHPTIYAKLNSTPSTRIWFKHLRRFFYPGDFEPHITIARTVPNTDFNQLWPHFKNLKWNEQFMVDKLTILRRETIGHDKSYKVFKEIPFNRNLDFHAFAESKIKAPVMPLSRANLQQISLF